MSDAAITSDPARTGAGMLPRVRHLVDDLQRHSEHRGRTAAELIRERDASDRAAEASAEARRQALENRRLSEVADAQETFRQRTTSITEDLDRRERTIRERHAEARASLQDKAERNEETARTQLQEAVWLAETVYEASEDKPADRERVSNEGIEGRRRQIDLAIDRTLARLGRSGFTMTLPPLEAPDPGSATDAGETESSGSQAPPDEQPTNQARAHLARVADRATAVADATESWKSVRLFGLRMLPALAVLLVGGGAAAAWALAAAGTITMPGTTAATTGAGIGLGVSLLAGGAGHVLVRRTARQRLRELAAARREAAEAAATLRREAARLRRAEEFALVVTRDRDIAAARTRLEPVIVEIGQRLARKLEEIDAAAAESLERVSAARTDLLIEETRRRDERIDTAEREAAESLAELQAAVAGEASERHARFAIAWSRLVAEWNDAVNGCERMRADLDAEARRLFPAWDHPSWEGWSPPHEFAPSASLATITVDRRLIEGSLPEQPDFQDPMPASFTLPVTLDFPDRCSLLVETTPATREAGLRTIQAAMMRLLAATPPGKLQFTIIDPVGLGESFAGFMHLGDHDEAFVGGRIWTETRHIEQRLSDLTEHMEHVIQKYLRNAYDSIADYNEAAGEIAEPYRFLVIADFPAAFSEAAAARLASILASGPRCGVFTVILGDARRGLPPGIDRESLEQAAVILRERDGHLAIDDPVLGRWPLTLPSPPAETLATRLLHEVGVASKDARRVEVPFDVISPAEDGIFSRTSEREIRVPLGKSGATRLQEFVIGPGTSQHALIAGKTGSGKSTLMHVLVTNLAQWYGPDEVRFYLVDFKKGVEFKTYATHDLPHALAVAVESDREFGLSVLERIDEELRMRGEKFRDAGVQDVAGWRRARPQEPMPRILLIIDEFQELFVEDDKIGQDAALLMDRIVRQGRAFGVHVILGSQTLGGSYSLPRSTLGQMQVRIALQCSESDAYLIMSDDNAAARLLSRPGEAIYNDAGGRIEGNNPFQIVWLPEPVREQRLAAVRERAERDGHRRETPLVVFEGNVPADLSRNDHLAGVLAGRRPKPAVPVAWLGEAIAIKGPTEAVFHRRSGANLLIVGQRDEAATAMMIAAGISLAATCPPESLVVLDGTPPDTTLSGLLESSLGPLPITVECPTYREVDATLDRLAGIVRDRASRDDAASPPVFLFIHGLQRFRSLRASDEFGFSSSFDEQPPTPKPDRLFAEILEDGPPVGVHVIAWCDTVTNLMRTLPRQGLREFEQRVAFQMGGADSTQLIDSPEAASIGLQRAMFFSEETGRLEKFRPYARPTSMV